MRATALGFATEYAAAIAEHGGGTMPAEDIVSMANTFLEFLMHDNGQNTQPVPTTDPNAVPMDNPAPTPAPAAPDVTGSTGNVQTPTQPAPDQPPAPVVEPPQPAPPQPPAAPVPEQPAPATDQSAPGA